MERREFLATAGGAISGVALLERAAFGQGVPAARILTPKYLKIRSRFVRDFELDGQVAESREGTGAHFGDQSIYLGFALLTFAGEARTLANGGSDAGPSERMVTRLLDTFDRLDNDAERDLHRTNVPGFFMRDHVKGPKIGEVSVTGSDYMSGADDADMSLDQIVGLIMGLWAVSHWSTNEVNRKRARQQADRVMDYLLAKRFMIDKPGTTKPVKRGDDARAAAGFLCNIAEDITGEDYYHRAKVRLAHNNRCNICAGSGQVNAPDPNLHCVPCSGSGRLKVVMGGGRCEVCRGTGDVRIVVAADCPTCSGSGEIRIVVTDWKGDDRTIGKRKCGLCGGDGKIGGKTELGKCKVCGDDGKLPKYTRDLGQCELCGGTGRWKGKVPKIKCLPCGGTGEYNVYVRVTHPLILGLEPLTLARLHYPKISLNKGVPQVEAGSLAPKLQSFVRHMNLVLMALDHQVKDDLLTPAALDSAHPWSLLLRSAARATVCWACDGRGKIVISEPKFVHSAFHVSEVKTVRREIGPCKVCDGTGRGKPAIGRLQPVLNELVRMHRSCPEDGPSDRCPSADWVKDSRWIRCTDLARGNGNSHYNGLDFLSLEVMMHLIGQGQRLR